MYVIGEFHARRGVNLIQTVNSDVFLLYDFVHYFPILIADQAERGAYCVCGFDSEAFLFMRVRTASRRA
jgi:hypothetical protein